MSRFIRLSNCIINTAHILRVDIYPEKPSYEIIMAGHHITGVWLFGTGLLDSGDYRIITSKEEHPESYKAIDDWIKNMPM